MNKEKLVHIATIGVRPKMVQRFYRKHPLAILVVWAIMVPSVIRNVTELKEMWKAVQADKAQSYFEDWEGTPEFEEEVESWK